LNFNTIVDGICEFRNRFKKSILLEVFLLSKINDLIPEIENIASLVNRINPDKVQLNTVARPPAEEYARPISTEKLMVIKNMFKVNSEVIHKPILDKSLSTSNNTTKNDEILALLERRPCTIKDVANSLGLCVNETVKQLDQFSKRKIKTLRFGDDRFFYRNKEV